MNKIGSVVHNECSTCERITRQTVTSIAANFVASSRNSWEEVANRLIGGFNDLIGTARLTGQPTLCHECGSRSNRVN